jgi:hypothetical protein
MIMIVHQTHVSLILVQDVQTQKEVIAMVIIAPPIVNVVLSFAFRINAVLVQLNKVCNVIIFPVKKMKIVLVKLAIKVFAFHAMIKKNQILFYVVDKVAIQMLNVLLEPAKIIFAFHVILHMAFIVQGQNVRRTMTV